MAGVYVFDYNDVDFDTTGLVGDLQPIECTFYEEKNGESSLTMRLCYDPLHKWAAVKVGSYIKAQVPVRIPPKIINNKYAEEVMIFRVKNSVDAYAYIWESSGIVERPQGNPMIYPMFMYRSANEKKQVKVKRRIKAGTEVLVLEQYDDGRCKVYLPDVGSGWTVLDNLEQDVSYTIPATFVGVESATTATRLSYQLFQVATVEQTLDSVTVTARHVFYELATTYTSYKNTWPVEAHKAIEGIFDGLVTPEDRFTCLTDASHKAGALDYERVNMVQALLDPENGICAQYGLSLIRDNYDLYALKNVGSDRGFVVEYGKNMLSVERIEDISNVVTRIIPFGKDAKGNLVFMDGNIYVDSAHIDEYAMPRTMYLDCSDTATVSDTMNLAQVKAELKARAQAEFAAGCDLPELTMTVDFISLGDTEEYKQYRNLDKVYLFDRITVKDKVRGYDYNAEVVAITHNVLTGQLESVTLGSVQKGTGTRKIATWQVPEVDGANIRLQSIAAGVLAGGAVSEDNLQDGSVGTRAIAAYSVTAEKMAADFAAIDFIEAGEITTDKLDAGAVTAEKIDTGAVTTEKLAAGAVKANTIDANAITTEKIATGAITAESGIIAESAIGTTQIADGSITSAKIVSLNADVITSGTLSTERLLIKGTDGIIYEINAQASGLTAAQLTDEQYRNRLNGTVIVAESITAAQLAANSVTANKILAEAVTTAKLAADAVTADKIKAGAITTAKVSSDFGQSLDLSSNTSINAIVSGLTQTYVQYDQPTGAFNVGDLWIKAQANTLWSALQGSTWENVKGRLWRGWATSEQPKTYVWDGTQWVLTVDYDVVQENQTSIRQTAEQISLKADQTVVDALSGTVVQQSTEIRQTAEQISLKANKDDPAGGVQTSTVTVDAQGVNIATGGTFTVDSGNFDIDAGGNMSAQNAYLSGAVYVNGSPALSQRNIYVGTNAPSDPVSGMVWIKPDASTSAQTTFSAAVPWSDRAHMVDNPKTGNLTGTATAAVGTVYTYRIRIPVYIREYSKMSTGAVLHFDITGASGGTLQFTRNVTIEEYGSGNKVIEIEATGGSWLGNNGTLSFSLYTTALADHYAYNVLNSSDAGASITVECISTASSGASGWRDCAVFCYA